MKQSLSVITLGVADMARSRRFYVEGFGWAPVFESPEITFYQMNGFVLGTFLEGALKDDMKGEGRSGAGLYALAHNVPERDEVQPAMEKLLAAGGSLMRAADAPEHGGFRGYVADPDGHPWEVAWNPAWPIDEDGHVTFGV